MPAKLKLIFLRDQVSSFFSNLSSNLHLLLEYICIKAKSSQKVLSTKLMIGLISFDLYLTIHSKEAIQIAFDCSCYLDHAQKRIYEYQVCLTANKRNLLAQIKTPAPISTKTTGSFANL